MNRSQLDDALSVLSVKELLLLTAWLDSAEKSNSQKRDLEPARVTKWWRDKLALTKIAMSTEVERRRKSIPAG